PLGGVRPAGVSALRLSPPRPPGRLADDCGVRAVGVHAGRLAYGGARRRAMKLLALGCSFRTTPVEVRERVAFTDATLSAALDEINVRYGCESVIIGTCNRVELYAARPGEPAAPDAELLTEFLSETHQLPADRLRPYLYTHRDGDAVRHLFRVAAGL